MDPLKTLCHQIEATGADPEEILQLVRDALEALADETQAKEPYATRSIDAYRSAARIVGDMAADVEPSDETIAAMNAALARNA